MGSDRLAGQEEKDLRRVFDFLAGGSQRKKQERSQPPARVRTHKRGEAPRNDWLELNDTAKTQPDDAAKVITVEDLDHALRALSRRCPKKQLEYMIWEVDENLDGKIDWPEFKRMYLRNSRDESGLEPFELFNIVQFMTYLPSLKITNEFKAQITEDDTMCRAASLDSFLDGHPFSTGVERQLLRRSIKRSTLFGRYGRDQTNGRIRVEKLMAKLFGDKADKGESVLSLDEYLKIVGVRNYVRTKSSN